MYCTVLYCNVLWLFVGAFIDQHLPLLSPTSNALALLVFLIDCEAIDRSPAFLPALSFVALLLRGLALRGVVFVYPLTIVSMVGFFVRFARDVQSNPRSEFVKLAGVGLCRDLQGVLQAATESRPFM